MGSRPVEAVVRFETPAGRQGQVDFATFTLPWGRRHALVVVLSHSRLLWLRFYRRQTMAVLTEGLERSCSTRCARSCCRTAAWVAAKRRGLSPFCEEQAQISEHRGRLAFPTDGEARTFESGG